MQAGLFLAAILAPCLVLVALSVRMVGQDRELADKRAQDTRRLYADRSGQELLSRLERLKLEAVRGRKALPGRTADAIALIAEVKDGRPRIEWDEDPAAARFGRAIAEPAFSQSLAVGQRQEFVVRDYAAALAAYGESVDVARSAEQAAAARLGAMRAALGAGRSSDAGTQIDQLLRTSVALVDEEGVPVALYAAMAAFRAGTRSRSGRSSWAPCCGSSAEDLRMCGQMDPDDSAAPSGSVAIGCVVAVRRIPAEVSGRY